MHLRILATALLVVLAPQFASATHGKDHKNPEQNPGQLRCHLDRCTKERDSARNDAKALSERLAHATRELQVRKERADNLSKELEARKSDLDAAAGKRRELEQNLAKALQNRSAHAEEIGRLTESLRQHAERQKQDADALSKARYGIEQAKNELNAAVRTRQELEARLAETTQRAEEAEKLIASLQQTIREKDELQKRTAHDLHTARTNFEKVQNELRSAAETKKQLDAALAAARAKSEETGRKLWDASKAASTAKSHLERSQAELAASQERLARSEADSKEKEQKLRESAARKNELEDSLAKAVAAEAATRAEFEEIKKRLAAENGQHKEAASALASAHDEVTRLRSVLEKSGEAHRALETELVACRKHQTAALFENTQLKESLAKLTESHKKSESDLATTTRNLGDARSEIAKLEEQQKTHRALETRYRELATRHETVVKELRSRQEALAAAGQDIRQLEQKRENDTDLITRLTQELNRAHQSAESKDRQHAALRDELAKIKEVLGRVGEIGAAHRELQNRHNSLQAECRTAEAELAKSREAHRCCDEKLKAALGEADKLRSALDRTKTSLHESESRRAETEKKLADCLGQGAESRRAIAELHARLEESERRRHHLEEEKKNLTHALGERGRHLEKSTHTIRDLEHRLAEVEKQLGAANKSRIEIETELAYCTRTATEALEAAKSLRGEIAERDALIAKLKTENDQLRHRLDHSQKEAAENRKQLEAELARAHSQLKAAADALAASQSKRQVTESSLLAATREIAQLKNQLAKQDKSAAAIIAKLTGELNDVTKLLEICTGKHAALEARIAESEKSRTDLAAANRDLAAQLEDALNAKPDEKIVKDLADTRARLAAAEKARQVAERLVIELRTQMSSIQKEADAFRAQLVRIDPVYYSINRADIEEQEARVLAQVREVLEFYPEATFHLVGHTCNIGSPDSNLTLSKRRANCLSAFLSKNRIPSKKISTEGVGEANPAAANTSEIGRRLNRHTAIQVNLHIE